jgi:hypothetical protein
MLTLLNAISVPGVVGYNLYKSRRNHLKMVKFKNNKTGNIYRLLGYALDCTNSRDGTPCVVYYPDECDNTLYVREQTEFFNKFTEVTE